MTVKVVDSEIEWFISRESHEAEGNETWVFRSLNTIEADISVEVENVENLEELTEEETTKLKLIKNHGENYVCFCGFLSPDIRLVFSHFDSHRGWQDYLKSQVEGNSRNVHLNPSWKTELKANFQEKVIDKCSQDTREAWATRKEEKNIAKFTEIRNEIIRKLVDALYEAHGLVSTPSYHTLEGIISDILADHYP